MHIVDFKYHSLHRLLFLVSAENPQKRQREIGFWDQKTFLFPRKHCSLYIHYNIKYTEQMAPLSPKTLNPHLLMQVMHPTCCICALMRRSSCPQRHSISRPTCSGLNWTGISGLFKCSSTGHTTKISRSFITEPPTFSLNLNRPRGNHCDVISTNNRHYALNGNGQ